MRQSCLKGPIRLLLVLFSFLMFICFNITAFSVGSTESKPITVLLNGKALEFDVNPYIRDGRTLVPFRKIFEAFGMEVDWNSNNRTVFATSDMAEISLTIASTNALVNGSEKTLDVPAEITKSRTFVPLRFIGESLGADVKWDGDKRTVTITTSDNEPDVEVTPTPTPDDSICKLGETAHYNGLSFSIDKVDFDPASNRISVKGKISSDKVALSLYMYNKSGTRAFANPIILDKTGDMYNFSGFAFVSPKSDFNKVIYIEVKVSTKDSESYRAAEYYLE